ncbi:DUF2087 domain-containing protein [Chromobacterium haemolyticum]|uniref:DUF2087 domain-containing protein n=1 Tax=Chromobacterium haemolyticum TaxID=394935 RepID=UPI002448469B|nr:DUF2087 domain-containing protein [Chromobacterium haemolyticum]MDH0342602.1 DUF2087 domain-containing protein [Chromobacterium haemolyticum]
MSRTLYPFYCSDISALARSLKQQWAQESAPPSHVHILNMLARSAGFQNFQHWRAECERPAPSAALSAETTRLLRHYDAEGRLTRWPKKFSEQRLCLWVLWAGLPQGGQWSEPEVNALIRAGEVFGDHVLLRRELVEQGLLGRTPDCRRYWRVERQLTAEAGELAAEVSRRRAGR